MRSPDDSGSRGKRLRGWLLGSDSQHADAGGTDEIGVLSGASTKLDTVPRSACVGLASPVPPGPRQSQEERSFLGLATPSVHPGSADEPLRSFSTKVLVLPRSLGSWMFPSQPSATTPEISEFRRGESSRDDSTGPRFSASTSRGLPCGSASGVLAFHRKRGQTPSGEVTSRLVPV